MKLSNGTNTILIYYLKHLIYAFIVFVFSTRYWLCNCISYSMLSLDSLANGSGILKYSHQIVRVYISTRKYMPTGPTGERIKLLVLLPRALPSKRATALSMGPGRSSCWAVYGAWLHENNKKWSVVSHPLIPFLAINKWVEKRLKSWNKMRDPNRTHQN